jgi:hypothetical protein
VKLASKASRGPLPPDIQGGEAMARGFFVFAETAARLSFREERAAFLFSVMRIAP